MVDDNIKGRLSRRQMILKAGGLTAAGLSGAGMFPSLAAASDLDGRSVRTILEVRRNRVIVQDFDISCGAAALATILRYQHGENITEREVALGLIQRKEYIENPRLIRIRQGFSLLDLKRFVEARGYEGVGFGQLEFDNLVDYQPLIVPVDFKGYNHFVVYRGHLGDNVVLADPAYGNRTMTISRFMRGWMVYPELGRIGFVVNRKDGLIPPNRLEVRPDEFRIVNLT